MVNSEKFRFETDGQIDGQKSALVELRFAAKKAAEFGS